MYICIYIMYNEEIRYMIQSSRRKLPLAPCSVETKSTGGSAQDIAVRVFGIGKSYD